MIQNPETTELNCIKKKNPRGKTQKENQYQQQTERQDLQFMKKKMLISLISLTNDLVGKIGKGCEEIDKEIKYLQNLRGLGGMEVGIVNQLHFNF